MSDRPPSFEPSETGGGAAPLGPAPSGTTSGGAGWKSWVAAGAVAAVVAVGAVVVLGGGDSSASDPADATAVDTSGGEQTGAPGEMPDPGFGGTTGTVEAVDGTTISVRDDSDNGSIIDFIQHRRRCSIGEVRQELRPWVGGAFVRPVPGLYVPEVAPVSRDRAGVIRALAGMRPLVTHRYLEEERGMPRTLLEHPRFAGRVLVDARSNVVFPHADRDGPCGYEVKNRGFTGFAPGGEKGLWISGVQRTDTALVLAESGIDALSYAALHPDDNARYASFGGAMNPFQPALIRAAIERLAQGAAVRIATDNDEEGAGFAAIIEGLVAGMGRGGLAVERAVPVDAKDWNDVLRRRRESIGT